ncbi:MAG: hypothetical protein JOZ49_10955 [Mycolicibacterium sp.]|nr:hypothetical protein [Mycolicibacterium sp.]
MCRRPATDLLIRQRNLERIVSASYSRVAPHVGQLAGEHVAEIIEVIAAAVAQLTVLGSPERGLYGRFAADNPAVIELTSVRVAGYWDL